MFKFCTKSTKGCVPFLLRNDPNPIGKKRIDPSMLNEHHLFGIDDEPKLSHEYIYIYIYKTVIFINNFSTIHGFMVAFFSMSLSAGLFPSMGCRHNH